MAVQISGNDITVPRDGSFTRNVTIGGTLTYEDVTNIDSVGLITARNGIEIGARPGVAASISVDGNMIMSGISTFGGDVQVPDKIIHSGDTDTAIRFSGADTITAETGGSSRFKIDSSGNVTIGNDGDSGSNPSSGYDELCIEGGNEAIGMCFLSPAANDVEQTIAFGDSNNNQSGKIQYEHANDAMHFDTGGSERLRIASSGQIGLSGANYGTSGQVLTSQGSGSAVQWATPTPAAGSVVQTLSFFGGEETVGAQVTTNKIHEAFTPLYTGSKFAVWLTVPNITGQAGAYNTFTVYLGTSNTPQNNTQVIKVGQRTFGTSGQDDVMCLSSADYGNFTNSGTGTHYASLRVTSGQYAVTIARHSDGTDSTKVKLILQEIKQ